MMLRPLLVSAALVLPACAAFGAAQGAAPTDPVTRGGSELRAPAAGTSSVPQLDLSARHLSFPSLKGDADLPSADASAIHMQKVLGDSAAADVHLCVDGTGNVATARLLRTSGMATYDAGVIHDVKAWKFEAPAGGNACTDLTVVYTLR